MVLAADPPTAGERDHLAARADATWPGADDRMPLALAWLAAQWLLRLGRDDLLQAHRGDAHALLARHQVRDGDGRGGFTDFLELQHGATEATLRALELMEHFGAPPEVDLPALHDWIERTWHRQRRLSRGNGALEELAARLRFARLFEVPRRSTLQRIVDERVFLATCMLAVLCLYATWLARPPARAGQGALP
jgi:hypothetical protein